MSARFTLPLAETLLEAAGSLLVSLKGSGPLLVAVSGGGDSTALLAALQEAATGLGRPTIVAATVDHGLRSTSADEARHVAAFCAARGIRHFTLAWAGEKPAAGLQEAARLARYRLLADLAERLGAIGIATGHTADDQAETIAMRAGRGSQDGDDPGLAGMALATLFGRSQWILRPLLGMRRHDLRHWLCKRNIAWIDDPSNEDMRFERVRVRRLPLRLGRAEVLEAGRRRQAQSDAVAALLSERARGHGGPVISLSLDEGEGADPLTHRAAAILAALAGGRRHLPSRRSRERLAAFVDSGELERMTLSRAIADRRRDGLYFYRERRNLPVVTLVPGESDPIDGRYRVRIADAERVDVVVPDRALVGSAAQSAEFAELPAGVVRRVLAAEPVLSRHGERCFAFEPMAWATVERHLALFDVFLPLFEYRLANQCAALFGRPSYRWPPLDIG